MATTQNGERGARKSAAVGRTGTAGRAAKKGAATGTGSRASARQSTDADERGRKAPAARGAQKGSAQPGAGRGGTRKAAAADAGTGRGAGAKKSSARGGAATQRGAGQKGTARKSTAQKGAAQPSAARGATGARKSPARRGAARSTDALDLLKQDHERVEKLIRQFERLKKRDADDADKAEVAGRMCEELTLHAQLEEELFYPALRERLGDDEDLVDEAQVEHDSAKSLIAQIQAASAGEPRFDALVTVLGEYVRHHVQEEESQIFRKAKRAKLDTAALGGRIAQRKSELQAGAGGAGMSGGQGTALPGTAGDAESGNDSDGDAGSDETLLQGAAGSLPSSLGDTRADRGSA